MLSQPDQNASSPAPLLASAAFPWPVGLDEWGLFEVPKQWMYIQELKVRFSVSDRRSDFQKCLSVINEGAGNI